MDNEILSYIEEAANDNVIMNNKICEFKNSIAKTMSNLNDEISQQAKLIIINEIGGFLEKMIKLNKSNLKKWHERLGVE